MEVIKAMPQPQALPWARTATASSLGLRIGQLMCALAALATTATTGAFSSHPALCFLAATSTLQCVWTVPLALLNVYTLLSGQWPLENHHWIAGIAAITGDRVAAALSFFAASAASGVATMVGGDLKLCAALPCAGFRAAAGMGFASCIAMLPTLLFNRLINNAGDQH